MTTRNARQFIASIQDAPEDDVPRLVFADWLEENGESARAEFIRVQCELARLPTFDTRYPELHLRQLELLAEHEVDWLGEWAERLVRWEFRRGLLHAITITPQPFVKQGEELFLDHPVQRVALVNERGNSLVAEEVPETVSAPVMGQVRAVETAGCRRDEPLRGMYGGRVITNAWLSALASARHVTRLEELHLNGDTRSGRDALDLDTWRRFCRARHLRTLRRLDLSDAYTHDHGETLREVVQLLGKSSFVKELRSLSFARCHLDNEGIRQLASAPWVHLEDLDLGGCDVLGADGLEAVLMAPSLSQLRSLSIPYGMELQVLAGSPRLGQLHTLRLHGDSRGGSTVTRGNWTARRGRLVGQSEWETLFRSPHLQKLTTLTVSSHSEIPPEAIIALWHNPWSANLQEFTLSAERLRTEHLTTLFARPAEGPTPLRSLSFPDCDGIGKALAKWPGLAGLTDLSLTRMFAQDCAKDTAALLKSPHFSPRLERLDLSGSCPTQANVNQLARCTNLSGLRWLGFGWNDLNPRKMHVLMHAPHLRHLESLHLSSMYGVNEVQALVQLAKTDAWPRLRDLVVGSGTDPEGIDPLQERFGPRLRVWADC